MSRAKYGGIDADLMARHGSEERTVVVRVACAQFLDHELGQWVPTAGESVLPGGCAAHFEDDSPMMRGHQVGPDHDDAVVGQEQDLGLTELLGSRLSAVGRFDVHV